MSSAFGHSLEPVAFAPSLPNEDAITRLVGALLFEQNDEWQSQNRYMQLEAFALIDAVQTDPLLSISSQAA